MRLGVCTTDFQRDTADAIFAKAAGFGFECVQLSLDSVAECGFVADKQCEFPGEIPGEALDAIRKASEKYHLPIVSMNGTFNMAHPDEQVRREGLRRFAGLMEIAKELGRPMVSLCSGSRNPNHLWRTHPDNVTEAAYRDMLECMKRCAEMAEKADVTLAIETEAANVIRTPQTAARVLRDVGSGKLKMILDCANLFLPGRACREFAKDTLDEAFYWFGYDIALAHGKDIRPGKGISFCATGLGIVDFPHALRLLKQYGFEGDMVLHGIYEDGLFPGCVEFMRKIL